MIDAPGEPPREPLTRQLLGTAGFEPLNGMSMASPPPLLSFDGVIESASAVPPDTHLAVSTGLGSAGRVVMVTNGDVQVWDKLGTVRAGPLNIDTMFGVNVFDPKVLFDQHTGRFFIVALRGNTPTVSNIRLAVSSSSTPGNLTSDWTFLTASAVTSFGGVDTWADYPGIGADAGALFVTANMFDSGNAFRGVKIRVFDKTALLAGVMSFQDIDLDDTVSNIFTLQPAHTFGTTDNGGFYLISRNGSTNYHIVNVTGHPTAPVADIASRPWNGGAYPLDTGADQLGSTVDLDVIPGRVMNAVYRGGHLWCCLTSDPDNDGQTEVVWQDIATNGSAGAATVAQSGFINGTGTLPWTYVPAIAVNDSGDAILCYTQSSASQHPGVWYATRESDDGPGTFREPVLIEAGNGFYDSFSSRDPDRWGDYAGAVSDPEDETFWVANEFSRIPAVAASKWGTRIAHVATLPPTSRADFDDDGDVDLDDHAHLQACLSGAGIPQNDPLCHDARLDNDSDIDASDLALFVTCLSGSQIPADIQCPM